MRMLTRSLFLSFPLFLAGLSLLACESAPRQAGRDDAPPYAREIDYGPREEARRPAGLTVESLFEPMDYATPNERRLGSGAPGPDYWQHRSPLAGGVKLYQRCLHLPQCPTPLISSIS